ncbi:hypothetical protein TSOC_004305 [Tetrabaena socialis]|uniref:Uncharacterized protein n=1 Tax=Tetrabaena socialis TaxID=47790 RepID=A0A2J8A993_9CHLO|nr:hypothetical protein TSOC_004305 [Tetrabaena socialis]|eukprot:PNH09102.1 hypothetical protein TSOC_004305 [Tetrabaena socialis]
MFGTDTAYRGSSVEKYRGGPPLGQQPRQRAVGVHQRLHVAVHLDHAVRHAQRHSCSRQSFRRAAAWELQGPVASWSGGKVAELRVRNRILVRHCLEHPATLVVVDGPVRRIVRHHNATAAVLGLLARRGCCRPLGGGGTLSRPLAAQVEMGSAAARASSVCRTGPSPASSAAGPTDSSSVSPCIGSRRTATRYGAAGSHSAAASQTARGGASRGATDGAAAASDAAATVAFGAAAATIGAVAGDPLRMKTVTASPGAAACDNS